MDCADTISRIGGGNTAERKRKKIGMTLVRGYPCFLTDVMDRKNKRTYHGNDKLVYIFWLVISKARFLKWCKSGVNRSFGNCFLTYLRYKYKMRAFCMKNTTLTPASS